MTSVLPEKASATLVKNRFGDYLGTVIRKKTPVLIEKHGKPVAIMVRYDQWQEIQGKVPPENERAPWTEACERFANKLQKKIKRRQNKNVPFSAVQLIHQIRQEEDQR